MPLSSRPHAAPDITLVPENVNRPVHVWNHRRRPLPRATVPIRFLEIYLTVCPPCGHGIRGSWQLSNAARGPVGRALGRRRNVLSSDAVIVVDEAGEGERSR